MKTLKRTKLPLVILLILSVMMTNCEQNASKKRSEPNQTDITTLEKQIELRLREYENYLRNGDSIALGNMYMEDAEIIPSTVGRENIIKVFGNMIRDSITGSSFKSTQLWGNEHLLVEDGTELGTMQMEPLWVVDAIYWCGKKTMENGKSYATLGSLTKRNS